VSANATSITVVIDTTAPTANFTAATDDVGTVQGALTSGDTTDDTALVLSGTNEAGSSVMVYISSDQLGAATVSGTSWSYSATVNDGTTYQFNVRETDLAGNTSAATNNFEVTGDTTAPTLSSSSPADDAIAVAVGSDIVLTFSEVVDVESGNITINTGGSTVAMIDVTSGLVTGTGTNTITINPASDLVANTNYNVLIDASAFDDSAGNSYAGITSTTALSFTTVSPSPAGTVTFDTAGTINGYVNSYSLGATNPSIGTLYIGPVNYNTASKVVAVGGDYGVGYHGSRTGMDSLQISTLNNSSNFGLSAFNVYNPSATTDYTLTITGYSDVVYWNSNETPICSTTGAATKNQWTTITVTGCDNVVTVIVEFTDDTELYFNDFVINEPID
jgi:hypothetical protein